MQEEHLDELDRILQNDLITPVYQQLVDLPSGSVVGFEALARGPAGSSLESPVQLFAAARTAGRLRQLDWTCRTVAVREALGGRLRPPLSLFLNSEPETIGSRVSAHFAESWARAHLAGLRLIFEVTERAVLDRPAQLLRAVSHIRNFGWGVALDDVGSNPASLALLPFVKPDVIKLDMGLLHGTAMDIGEIIFAVNAEAERSGAVLLAEGIETSEHLDLAHTMGATLGQGWFFGRPGSLPEPLPVAGEAIVIGRGERPSEPDMTPHRIVSKKTRTRRASRRQLVEASRLIERRAASLPHPPLLVSAFQYADRFSGRTRAIYEDLARRLPFVAAVAAGWTEGSSVAPRCVALSSDDPLVDEWAVGIVTPFSGMLLSARERHEDAEDGVFDACITFDRGLAIEGIGTLLQRLEAVDPELDGAEEDLEFAQAVSEIIAEAAHEEDLVRPLLRVMSEVTGLDSTFLSRVTDQERYDVVVSYNSGGLEVAEGYEMPWSESICHAALNAGQVSFVDVQEELPENAVGPEFGFRTYVTCPVVDSDGSLAGTLCGASNRVSPLSPEQVEMVRRFARLVGDRIRT